MESHSATPEKAKISPRAAGGSLQYLRPVSCRKDGQRGFLPSRPLCFFGLLTRDSCGSMFKSGPGSFIKS